ncbi:MAG: hypothetical protein LBQ76_07225 [Candidatus Fibromonas sp.]|jgi:uncharacterized protein (TIGR02145 family)|nr:hypothetical protein [Candidatus Fibromonas sp.]
MRIVFFLFMLACTQTLFAAVQTIAVLPSDGVISDDELEYLTDKAQEIAVSVLPKSGFEVFPQEVVIKRLGGPENYIKECKESSCIVELGKKASVDYVAQCRFGKLGSDLRITFELYNVKTSGLVDKFSETAKNTNGLLAIMEKRIPDGFMKIPGVATRQAKPAEAKPTPAPKPAETKTAPEAIGNVFTDARDNKKYKTVKIGNQIWMAENLNYDASDSKCYENNSGNCAKYGRLYDWATAKKACPSGWHLPSMSEYKELDKTVGGEIVAGKKLKAKSGWYSKGNGTDEFGFSALPGGYGTNSFDGIDWFGYWWSASGEDGSDIAYARYMYYDFDYTKNGSGIRKSFLNSVRCVKD